MTSKTPEIFVLSDIHYYEESKLPNLRALIQEGIKERNVRVIAVCGDVAESVNLFRAACEAIREEAGDIPVLVTIGNHDLCNHVDGRGAEYKYTEAYPQICAENKIIYLDGGDIFQQDGLYICGNTGWYDLTATYSRENEMYPREFWQTRARKKLYGFIDHKIEWARNDIQFSEECARKILKQLAAAEKDDSIKEVIVVTHVPLFYKEVLKAIGERGHDHTLDVYFYHPTLGNQLRCRFPKLRMVLSGHIHALSQLVIERTDKPPLINYTHGSDYNCLNGMLVNLNDYTDYRMVSGQYGVLEP